MHLVVVFPSEAKPSPDFQIVQDGSYKKLMESLHYPGPIHIEATYEGLFESAVTMQDGKRTRLGNGYGKKHEYDGRIVLRQVSEVWTKPLAGR
jgi:hypothetical protein